MNLYFIRHKPTGHYMPEPMGRQGRGGSHTEPDADKNKARIFRTERSAKMALSMWLKGKFYADRGGYDYDFYEDITVVPVTERNRDEMEIVKKKVGL